MSWGESENPETQGDADREVRLTLIRKWRNQSLILAFSYFFLWIAWGISSADSALKTFLGILFLLLSLGIVLFVARLAWWLRGPVYGLFQGALALAPVLNLLALLLVNLRAWRENTTTRKKPDIPQETDSSLQAEEQIPPPEETESKKSATGLFFLSLVWTASNFKLMIPFGFLLSVIFLVLTKRPARQLGPAALACLLGFLGTGFYLHSASPEKIRLPIPASAMPDRVWSARLQLGRLGGLEPFSRNINVKRRASFGMNNFTGKIFWHATYVESQSQPSDR